MKPRKITKEEIREWQNVKQGLVGEDGKILRHVEKAEEEVLAELRRKVKETRRSMEWTNDEETKKIAVSLERTDTGGIILKQTIDGMTIESGRSLVRKSFFARYGECRLILPNGKFFATIRDPQKTSPTIVPDPSDCKCKTWGQAHPGRHHQNCPWNELAPIEKRSKRGRSVSGGKIRTVVAPEKSRIPGNFKSVGEPIASVFGTPKPKQRSKDEQGVPVISPEKCDCRIWAKTTGSVDGEHHPLCGKREAWEKHGAPKNNVPVPPLVERKFLVDLNTRRVLRDASPEEIADSEGGILTIGDETFGVISESELRTPSPSPEVTGAPA